MLGLRLAINNKYSICYCSYFAICCVCARACMCVRDRMWFPPYSVFLSSVSKYPSCCLLGIDPAQAIPLQLVWDGAAGAVFDLCKVISPVIQGWLDSHSKASSSSVLCMRWQYSQAQAVSPGDLSRSSTFKCQSCHLTQKTGVAPKRKSKEWTDGLWMASQKKKKKRCSLRSTCTCVNTRTNKYLSLIWQILCIWKGNESGTEKLFLPKWLWFSRVNVP